ncbi:MAG: hypothetical protein M3020_19115 [Myxococcota bacterium]|nr:hypothetical protein [Myxococcota bacterium]
MAVKALLCVTASLALVCLSTSGCATSVQRLGGELPTSAGHPSNDCERSDWLVVAPTRAELFDRESERPLTRDDGLGLYRVGEQEPEALSELAPLMATDGARFARHGELVRVHDRRQVLAGALGVAGVIAIAIGSVVFISAFDTKKTTNELGAVEEEQTLDGGKAALGGVLAGVGFTLGGAGIALTPSHTARAQAEADRYVLFPPIDPSDKVLDAVGRYNQRVRTRCARPSR